VRIGAHVSAAGGLDRAIDRALAIEAETIQVFGSPPQTWQHRLPALEQIEAFRRKVRQEAVGPTFLHAIYLINLATDNPANLARSRGALIFDMHLAAQIGALGVIFHVGSHRGRGLAGVFDQIAQTLGDVLAETPEEAWLILENSAGMGGQIGDSFAEIGALIKAAGSARLKVCLDTQHAFASGYDVTTPAGLEATMGEFEREIGLERLVAVHANDSKCPLGGGKDRHENIGQGYIGEGGFRLILGHPAFRDLPFLLEVPGFNGQGPDLENVRILRSLAGLA